LSTFPFEQVGDSLTEALVSSDQSVAFPDTDTNGFMAGFQQAQGNKVADAGSTRNKNRAETSPGITSANALSIFLTNLMIF
jgi:hypothetical protein